MSPNKRVGSPLQKGGSLAAFLESADSEGSATSTADLLGAGGRSSSPTAQDRLRLQVLSLMFTCRLPVLSVPAHFPIYMCGESERLHSMIVVLVLAKHWSPLL